MPHEHVARLEIERARQAPFRESLLELTCFEAGWVGLAVELVDFALRVLLETIDKIRLLARSGDAALLALLLKGRDGELLEGLVGHV